MANGTKCRCRRCVMGGLLGPVVLVTLGVLFLIGQLHLGYGFRQLWPVLLVVIGVVKLAQAMASGEGHVSS